MRISGATLPLHFTFLTFVTLLTPACATTPDPTEMSEVRRELGRLAEDRFLADGGLGAHACLLDGAGERCREWRRFRADLLRLAADAPLDRYVVGQVVYSLVRNGAHEEALATLSPCRTDPWWCRALRGFALAESGRVVEAEEAFDEALRRMPRDERCEWTDLSALVSGDVQSAYEEASCPADLERFWWLVDAAWLMPGNDRRVEHYNRMVWAALHDDALTGDTGDGRVDDGEGHSRGHHPTVLSSGMDFIRADARWTVPADRPAYGVVPEDEALLSPFHASAADWPIHLDDMVERYVPPWGTLAPLDAQVAFFERGDSLVAAAAARVPDVPAFRDEGGQDEGGQSGGGHDAVLFLHTGPPSSPVTARSEARDGRWIFRVSAPRRRYVVGIESRGTRGLARVRHGHGLPHEPPQPLRLSDLLLFRTDGGAPPDSLDAAVPLMKGGSRWTPGETIGVFLEVHAPDGPRPAVVSVELERRRSWLARLGGLLGLGGGTPVELEWSQPAADGRFPISFTLDAGDASEGEYTLRVSVEVAGLSSVTVGRELRIVEE